MNDNLLLNVIPIAVGCVSVLIVGIVLYRIMKSVMTWMKNNNSEQLAVHATVKTKRTEIRHYNTTHSVGSSGAITSNQGNKTYYFATFQLDNGERIELKVNGNDYGQLAEGDTGILYYQGTRFQGFEREN